MHEINLSRRCKSSPAETLQKARSLVDERTGIIRALYEVPTDPDAPKFFAYGSILADTTQYGFTTSSTINGSTSTRREQAIAAAVGEAVERYCAAVVPDEELLTAAYRDLGRRAIDPRSLTLYSDLEYREPDCIYTPFHENQSLRWVQAYSLTNNCTVLLPACVVYLPYEYMQGEARILGGISTGLACGNTLEEAILSGIYEVVERDATMIMWHCGLSMPRISTTDFSRRCIGDVLCRFAPCRGKVSMIDVTTNIGIPAIVAIRADYSGRGPAVIVASSAGLSRHQAAIGALEELAQCVMWVKSMFSRQPKVFLPDLSDVQSRQDHVLWPARLEHVGKLAFMTEGSGESFLEPDEPGESEWVDEDISWCVGMLAEKGLEVIVVDITSPEIQEIGLHVVRVVIPGTQPLHFGHRFRRFETKRLSHVPFVLGYRASELAEADLNMLPHPFP